MPDLGGGLTQPQFVEAAAKRLAGRAPTGTALPGCREGPANDLAALRRKTRPHPCSRPQWNHCSEPHGPTPLARPSLKRATWDMTPVRAPLVTRPGHPSRQIAAAASDKKRAEADRTGPGWRVITMATL
jgi:hypothetical protein